MNFYEDIVQSQVTGLALRPTRAYLYRNDGTTFRDIAPQQGLARSFGSMGAGYGDVDYDGLIDIYLTNGGPIMARFEPNTLFHNRGDRFADVTAAAGVGNPGQGARRGFCRLRPRRRSRPLYRGRRPLPRRPVGQQPVPQRGPPQPLPRRGFRTPVPLARSCACAPKICSESWKSAAVRDSGRPTACLQPSVWGRAPASTPSKSAGPPAHSKCTQI